MTELIAGIMSGVLIGSVVAAGILTTYLEHRRIEELKKK